MAFSFKDLREPLILDGATGTQLQKRGMPSGVCSEGWILAHPEAILDVQRRYVAAGCRALYAPTFGANRISLGHHGLADRVREYCLALVELSRKAADDRAAIAGDMSSCGLAMGGVDTELFGRLTRNFTEQAAALEEADVDYFGIETQVSLGEARAAVQAVKAVSDRPVLVSFSLGNTGRSLCGGDPTALLISLEAMGVDAFGFNCVSDFNVLRRVLENLRPLTSLPLLAKPNAGFPVEQNGSMVYDLTPETMAEAALSFAEAGAVLIGGCCGTDESHIRAISETLAARPSPAAVAPTVELYASEYKWVDFSALKDDEIVSLPVTGDYDDEAEEAADEAKMLRLRIDEPWQLETVLDCQMSVRVPLWVKIPDRQLREDFRRLYHGKAKLEE
ncbi:MAG: homocysteine S-methyltransferase family protein [Ruminococcaceae bacterium]|nr:homocysteine S-methyltransferase family protein [Oscillospiraceae bacterium]